MKAATKKHPHLKRSHLESNKLADPHPKSDELVKSTWERFGLNQGAKPIIGAVIIGGVTAFVATQIGVTELAIALGAGYVSYRMLKYGISLPQALVEGIMLRRGILTA